MLRAVPCEEEDRSEATKVYIFNVLHELCSLESAANQHMYSLTLFFK